MRVIRYLLALLPIAIISITTALSAPVGICLFAYGPSAPADKIECFEFVKAEKMIDGYRFFQEPSGSVVVTAYRYRSTLPYVNGLSPGNPEFDRVLALYEKTAKSSPLTRQFLDSRIQAMRGQADIYSKEQGRLASLSVLDMGGKSYMSPRFKRIEEGKLVLSHENGSEKIDIDLISDAELKSLIKIDPGAQKIKVFTVSGKRLWNPEYQGISEGAIRIKHEKGDLMIDLDTVQDRTIEEIFRINPRVRENKIVTIAKHKLWNAKFAGVYNQEVRIKHEKGTLSLVIQSLSDIDFEKIHQLDSKFSKTKQQPSFSGSLAGEERDFEIAPGMMLTMCWIPAGEFLMGSPNGELDRFDNETQHRVIISKGYWLAKTETTQAQWQAVMGSNPSKFKGSNLPIESVSWDAIAGPGGFFNRLNDHAGSGARFQLPSEAQWEYAARAGTSGEPVDLNSVAWYEMNSGGTSHPVGKKKANDWGLYDMQGNVEEWCSDGYGQYSIGEVSDPIGSVSDSFRMVRGGSWGHVAKSCRFAFRLCNGFLTSFADDSFGFRIACSSVPPVTTGDEKKNIKPVQPGIPSGSRTGEERDFEIAPSVVLTMCWIPAGEFLMGDNQEVRHTKHHVIISNGYWLAKTETTQAQWQAVMGYNNSKFKGENLPVESVSWNDIAGPSGFLKRINVRAKDGEFFYLPSEAQWEYAALAGAPGEPADLNSLAWYEMNSGGTSHPVGKKKANDWGLYDMQGNVWEWCSDWEGDYPVCAVTDPKGPAFGTDKVVRGGSYDFNAYNCRIVNRYWWPTSFPPSANSLFGFRVACSAVSDRGASRNNGSER